MGEFRAEVFDGLAKLADKYGDNSFQTEADVTREGFPARIPVPASTRTQSTHDAIEAFKNAIFKILMLRARDNLKNAESKDLARTSIILSMSDHTVHFEGLDFDLDELLSSKKIVFEADIIPRIGVDYSSAESHDILDAVKFLSVMTLACR